MILGDDTYYVSSNTNDDCPQPCHPLSYYITDTATYFTSNATFIFMEGEHLLDSKGSVKVVINNTDNLTLRGERSHSNTNIIIRCSNNTRGLVFNDIIIINIYDVTITGCGQEDISPLHLINISSLHIHHIMLYNNMYSTDYDTGGILYINCITDTHITITDSTFANNTVGGNGGGLYIYGYDTDIYITITSSTFTYNTVGWQGGGLYIHVDGSGTDIHNITIINSTFTDNRVGNRGGGLYIYCVTYDDIAIHVYNMTIANSTFTNNTVGANGGGGLCIGIFDTDIHNMSITNSKFTNNRVAHGSRLGGGLYISASSGYGGGGDIYNIIITNSAFTNNTVGEDGGGLVVDDYHRIIIHNITITNSTLTSNTAHNNGGGLYIYGNGIAIHNIVITNSTLANNTVGGWGGGLYVYGSDTRIHNVTVTNSIFTDNTVNGGHGGGLGIDQGYIVIIASIFANNYGSGIMVHRYATVVFTEGRSIIANNSSPTDGGGIYLGEDCYLTTSNGGHASFINNTAQRYGGAIYSHDNNDYSLLYSSTNRGNDDDYFYYHNYYNYHQCTMPAYHLSADFANNSAAIAGDQLYGGVFIFCEIYGYLSDIDIVELNGYCPNVPDTIKNVPSVHPLSPISSDPLTVCPCVNGTVDCTVRSLDREVYPGQIFNVSLVTVGLCGGVSPGTVIVEYDKHIKLTSSATTDYTSTTCTALNYAVNMIDYIISNATITFNIGTSTSDYYNNWPIHVNLTILPCPLGLVVDFTSGDCVCSNDITHISGLVCNISWMPHPIQRSGINWIYHQDNCTIAYIGCPFDYCNTSPVKINLNQSDLQCNYNRSGILCGQCIEGLSLIIGSNRCANCTDTTLVSLSIVIIAAVAGVVLVILLLVLNLTVSFGSVNGLLFYANLVKLNESVFFSRGNIAVISQFISWCNLDMGFEYCFIDGLDGYVKTWLQFIFPVYVWFLVTLIIVGCRYSGRLSRLCGSNAVPVLATLILMSYTKLSRTITNALMINILHGGECKWNVWSVDGNIDYLGGKHAVLFAVSLLFLVTGLFYTGLVFSSQWLQRYSGKCCKSTRDPVVRLKPLIDAYTGPFKDKYRFWTGLCLIVRLILTVVFSFTTILQSKLNNYIILLTVGAMIIVAVGGRVYNNRYLTVLETFSHVNIICLCVMTVLFTDNSYSHVVSINVIVSVSVSMEILLFVVIVTVHCYLAFKRKFPTYSNCKLCCNYKTRVLSEDELPLVAGDAEEGLGSPARVITYREELIFDFYLNEEHAK